MVILELKIDTEMNKFEQKLSILKNSVNIENELYRYDKDFLKLFERLKHINNKCFIDFLVFKRLEGVTLSRINRYIYVYFKYLDELNLKQLTDLQLQLLFFKIKNSNFSSETKKNEWIIIKSVINYLHLNVNPSAYRLKLPHKTIFARDLLTEKEKSLILGSKMNLEKKVFFTILFDTGLRVGEVFSINRDSFKKIEKGYLITINKSKTELRVVFTFSHKNWVNRLLQTDWQTWTFGYPTTRKVLGRFEKKFGKRVYNHLARHGKVSELLIYKKLPIPVIKSYFGWKSTKMIEVYAHISQEDALNEVIQAETKK